MTERASRPLVAAIAAMLALSAVAVFAVGVHRGTTSVDSFQRAAGLLAALPAVYIAFHVRPAWLVSGGLALAVFNSHWSNLGIGLALDRLVLATGLIAVIVRERRTHRLTTRPIDWLLMLVGLYALCSAVLAGTLGDSQARFALLDRFGLLPFFLFFVAAYAFREERDRRILLGTLVAVGAYLGIVALLETTGPRALIIPHYINDPAVGIHYGRARGPFTESVADGLVMFACGTAAAMALAIWRDRRARVFAGAVVVLCGLGALFTVTRSVWIASIGGGSVALLAARETRRYFVPLLLFGTLLIVGALAVVPGLRSHVTERKNDQAPLYDRRNSNDAAVRMIDAKPLLGFGWGRYQTDSLDYYRQALDYPLTEVRNVHNVFLANAVELGLLGAGLWVITLLLVFGRAILRRGPPELHPWRIGLIAVFISYVVCAFVTPLGYALPTLLLWTWAGICWADVRGLLGAEPSAAH